MTLVRTYSWNTVLQLTFVSINLGLVRLASPRVYGTVAVQFELLVSTILFLSRKGIGNGLLRLL